MARIKYHYNPETCQYEQAKTKPIQVLFNITAFLILSFVFGLVIHNIIAVLYPKKENMALQKELSVLKTEFKMTLKQLDILDSELMALQNRDDNIYREIFGADPVPSSIRQAGAGGIERYKELLKKGLKNEKMILDIHKRIDKLKRKMYIQTKSHDEIVQLAKNKEDMLKHLPAIQPISNKQLTRLSSGFGFRFSPIFGGGQFHPGVDFAAPYNTPIYATADGEVEKAYFESGYGNMVQIDHGYQYKTLYAHMSKFIVEKGQKVKRGQCIGYVGSTGFSTAPHVHYEVMYKKKQVNPVYFFYQDLDPKEYDKILKLAAVENRSLH